MKDAVDAATGCHCLCGGTHPKERGICDRGPVTTRLFVSLVTGPVAVPMCAPCVKAYDRTMAARPIARARGRWRGDGGTDGAPSSVWTARTALAPSARD